MKKLIDEAKQLCQDHTNENRSSSSHDSNDDNVWDGVPKISQINYNIQHNNTNKDHRNRAAMSKEDREELISTLWSNQIHDWITKGLKDTWCFKKVKREIF